ncbi:uridine kinase [Psychrobium sp. 1_MG-2023]|uniref:uridine kinase n=1 Tax=Psychrobium sp. 1_MG-2023 TaxID=3062624 RepID=UPI000C32D04F|nr:uridine kinase [Psychrobium sp. 1_MG-2023]MDP2561680.1 uridine kinase [Psychrobium sp. 1_MG-2023]PKF57084.1 uridine kinase [Alteromonadales bacterium alter-6D02]
MKDCIFIAIVGASASGKSLLAQTIVKELIDEVGSNQIGVINEDYYYRDQSQLTMEERVQTNYDHPASLEQDLLVQHLLRLQQGEPVDLPQYCYTTHTRLPDTLHMGNKRVIVLEGILLLTNPELRKFFHASIYMDAPLDICLTRRLLRDVQQRGRTMDSVLEQYQQTVRPMFLQFIEPSKQYADIIVPRGGKNRIAIEMLKSEIHRLLNR